MDELIDLLKQSAGTGELLTIAYGGGSRPGVARQLTVVSCTDSDFRANEIGTDHAKTYKIKKILWVEDSSGRRIASKDAVHDRQSALPILGTLEQYALMLRDEFKSAGWHIHQNDELFGVGTCFKNGKPKKTPSIAISYVDRTTDFTWDPKEGKHVTFKKKPTGRERPWRVDSWRFKEGKTRRSLSAAMELFVEEVRASDPQEAKGMFAGH